MSENESECVALDRLALDFPDVPLRIIASVLVRYQSVTATLADAASAAHARITDACAV
jgi:hypothetical protein